MTPTHHRDALLAFEGVSKAYGGTQVLEDLSLTVPAGQLTVVYAQPAVGKSVLMRVLMGLEQPDAGRVLLRGEDVTAVPAAERNIGYVPQSFALYPHLSVHDNIAYPLTLAGTDADAAEPIVRHAADMLKIGDLLDKRPDQLSGGQKQRVAIARGIAKRTDLYVLDDPLAGLDFKLREQLVDDMRSLQAQARATFLYTTSDPVEALTLADHLAVLDAGRIVEAGDPDALYHDPARARTMALVGFPPANFIPGTLESRGGRTWCRTPLFDAPVTMAGGDAAGAVTVGIRPERVRLGAANGAGTASSGADLSAEFDFATGTGNGIGATADRTPETVAGPTGDAGSANGRGRTAGPSFGARVVLREDLGGEDIVYLDCGAGVALTSLDRRHLRFDRGDGDERVTVTIHPRDLVLFRPATGEQIGRGVADDDH